MAGEKDLTWLGVRIFRRGGSRDAAVQRCLVRSRGVLRWRSRPRTQHYAVLGVYGDHIEVTTDHVQRRRVGPLSYVMAEGAGKQARKGLKHQSSNSFAVKYRDGIAEGTLSDGLVAGLVNWKRGLK